MKFCLSDGGLSSSDRNALLTLTDDEDSYRECKVLDVALRAHALYGINSAFQRSRGQSEKMIFITATSHILIKLITLMIMGIWLHAAERMCVPYREHETCHATFG